MTKMLQMLKVNIFLLVGRDCCNLNLGLATKARACKGVGQE
jgi:hypothetical protein